MFPSAKKWKKTVAAAASGVGRPGARTDLCQARSAATFDAFKAEELRSTLLMASRNVSYSMMQSFDAGISAVFTGA